MAIDHSAFHEIANAQYKLLREGKKPVAVRCSPAGILRLKQLEWAYEEKAWRGRGCKMAEDIPEPFTIYGLEIQQGEVENGDFLVITEDQTWSQEKREIVARLKAVELPGVTRK